MSEEEKKAIEYLNNKHIYFDEYEAVEDYETEDKIKMILNLIEEQQIELDKKDKIIDLMAEQLTTPVHNKEWVINRFEKEVL